MEKKTALEDAVRAALLATEQQGSLDERARIIAEQLRTAGCYMRPTYEKRRQALIERGVVRYVSESGESRLEEYSAERDMDGDIMVFVRDNNESNFQGHGPYDTFEDAKAECEALTAHALDNPPPGSRVVDLNS